MIELVFGDNNLSKCTRCGNQIPKEIERVSYSYKTRYGKSYHRFCGLCILELSEKISKATKKRYRAMHKIIG